MSNHNSCGLCSIEMKNISVTSGEDILLDNINLTFHCGELTALIGKNGAGKTTLLRTLLGERHYKGSISFTWCCAADAADWRCAAAFGF